MQPYQPDGEVVTTTEPDPYAGMTEVPCYGVLVPEGIPSGDDPEREFAPGALTWAPLPVPFKWQEKQDEGHEGACVTGRIDAIWRDGALIRWIGAIDNVSEYGRELIRLREGDFVRGVSVTVDDLDQADIEYVYPVPPLGPEPVVEMGAEDCAVECDGSEFCMAPKHPGPCKGSKRGASTPKNQSGGALKSRHGGYDKASGRYIKPSGTGLMPRGWTPARGASADGAEDFAGDVLDDDPNMMPGDMAPMPDMPMPNPTDMPMPMDMPMDMDIKPIKIIFHSARIRSGTVVAEPAFVEATFELGESPIPVPVQSQPTAAGETVMVAAAVAPHSTATSDAPWDGPANEKQLPSPMPVAKAKAAYAFIDDGAVTNGQVTKEACRFIHHEVAADGTVGAANVKACQTGIGVLNGGRGGTNIPADSRQGVYDHLSGHLRDAGLEPPPMTASACGTIDPKWRGGPTMVAGASWTITIPEVWPESWFEEPTEAPPIGALNITAAGRVYGYLAPAGVTHRGFRGKRSVYAPTRIDYSEFQNKGCLVSSADGQVYKINAGNVTFDCGHASPLDPRRQDPSWAAAHYENSCSIAARVRVGENRHGTWVAGALLHGITPDSVERMMACALSGDWQDGKLKGALLVPVEGFPRAQTASVRVRADDEQLTMVASAVPVRYEPDPVEPQPDYGFIFDLVASATGRGPQTRFDELTSMRFDEYAAERG